MAAFNTPSKSTKSAERLTGTIVRWLPDKGFGFIQDPQGTQYFFHRSSVRDISSASTEVHQNQAVSFVPGNSPKGPRAEDVLLED
jgi:cold shock CspA family protein